MFLVSLDRYRGAVGHLLVSQSLVSLGLVGPSESEVSYRRHLCLRMSCMHTISVFGAESLPPRHRNLPLLLEDLCIPKSYLSHRRSPAPPAVVQLLVAGFHLHHSELDRYH